ncbi:MAG: Rab family GTPase [Chloroflexota bacterium]
MTARLADPRLVSKKVCLLGDFAVGKTSLVSRFVYNTFEERYLSTIGVRVGRKVITLADRDAPIEIALMLWDLGGGDEHQRVQASYLRGAAGALIVCDLTREESVDRLEAYASDLRAVSPEARVVLAANKADLAAERRVSDSQLEAIARRLDAPCLLTSALTGNNVEAAFRALAERIMR